MYCFRHCEQRKMNITLKLSVKQSMDSSCVHWINPLFYKCDETLDPYNISW